MKRAIIFYNGNLSDISQAKKYIKPTDFIICADGGARHAFKLGLRPDIVIGDFDSLSEEIQTKLLQESVETIKHRIDKDETDSELALSYGLKKGYTSILVFGLLGDRLDHLMTNIFFLANFVNQGADIMIVEGKQEMRLTNNTIILKGKIGELVSLIPLKGDVKQVTTQGLQYKITNVDLRFGYSFGLSDVMTHETAEISIKEGILLVIHERS